MKISSALKDAFNTTGIYEMPITVIGKMIKHNIIVVQNINSNAIMGANVNEQLGLVFYSKK